MTIVGSSFNGLVSVVTASFNSRQSIERTVLSVAQQKCRVLEHIIIDDGSVDGTPELLSELAGKFPHLKVLTQPNRGAGPARNAGIDEAKGRYIAFLDSDDVWLENKLRQQITLMEEDLASFTYGDYAVVDGGSGELLGQYNAPDTLSYGQLLTRCPIGCSTVAYNQEELGKKYMPAIRRGQDWALWLALTRNGSDAVKYPGCDVVYYCTKGSLSKGKLGKAFDMYRIYTIEEKISRFRSALLLAKHSANVMAKKPERITSKNVLNHFAKRLDNAGT